MAQKFTMLDPYSGSGYWSDVPDPLSPADTIAQMFGGKNSLTPIGTPELTSNGPNSAPFYKVNTAQGMRYFTPAFGKENGQQVAESGGEGGAITYRQDGNGGYDIAPWNNWSNDTFWIPQTEGQEVVNAPWAADLVKNLPYRGGMEYTGGGWMSDKPPAFRTFQREPETSGLTQFMQGPMIPLAGFLGAGLAGGALAGAGAGAGAGSAASAGLGVGSGIASGAGSVLGGAAAAGLGVGSSIASGGGSIGGAAATTGGGMDWWNDIIENVGNFTGGDGGGTIPATEWPTQTPWNSGYSGPQEYLWNGEPESLIQRAVRLSQQTGISPSNVLKMLQNGGGGNGSVLSRLLSGDAGAGDYLSAGGNLASTLLGMYASNQQTNALKELSDKYSGYGAPYRDKLAASYADPAGFLANSPDIQASVDQGTNAMARSLSTTGNPVGSGNSLQQLQDYATKGLYGQLGNERNRLANFGGLSNFNAASPGFSSQAVASQGNAYNALGSGIASLTNQNPTLADLLKAMQGGGNIFGTT